MRSLGLRAFDVALLTGLATGFFVAVRLAFLMTIARATFTPPIGTSCEPTSHVRTRRPIGNLPKTLMSVSYLDSDQRQAIDRKGSNVRIAAPIRQTKL